GGRAQQRASSASGRRAMRPLPDVGGIEARKRRVVHRPVPHDSAIHHVRGTARYIDDLPEPAGTLHLACGLAPVAKGRIVDLDLGPVRTAPGVVAVLTAADIPGVNDIS